MGRSTTRATRFPTLSGSSFGWRQYTPYWNDGDECIFGAHTDEPSINSVPGWDIWDGNEEDKSLVALQDKVGDFLSIFDDEDLELLFGDHAEVTVTRDGVIVEGYEHE